MTSRRVVILGAAGRDFHDFNVVYRDDTGVTVVAFTATQIPGIAGRRYPATLAGPRYPDGIPIVEESTLEALCRRERVTDVVFAYSDVSYGDVMRLGSLALATGADFVLLGPERTMLRAGVPAVAVSAVRTGCGKSPIARWLGRRLRERGRRVAVLRHPMPYADLERQRSQRFATPTSTPPAARSRSGRNTSRIWPRATSCSPAWITARSRLAPPPRPTSSCGTEATTANRPRALRVRRDGRAGARRTRRPLALLLGLARDGYMIVVDMPSVTPPR